MPSDIPLPGPPANSLLGFLSLLGLLRSLEEAETGWRPRLSWDRMVPRLHLDGQIGRQDVADAAARGIEKFGRRLRFPAANPDVDAEEFALWQGRLDPEVVGAIGSDACVKKGKDAVESTALCMMFGAGRQEFLPRLTLATAVDRENRHGVRKEVHDALFSRWLYSDTVPKIAFRWDPTEFRPHAMQDSDPKKEPVQTVNGANRLAAVGFTACQCVPTRRGLATTSCVAGPARLHYALWPVWIPPLSLAAIRVLMRLPSVTSSAGGAADAPTVRELRAYGVAAVMRAELFWEGKFRNVRAAEPIA